jgi:hypothetical protein
MKIDNKSNEPHPIIQNALVSEMKVSSFPLSMVTEQVALFTIAG